MSQQDSLKSFLEAQAAIGNTQFTIGGLSRSADGELQFFVVGPNGQMQDFEVTGENEVRPIE